MCDYSLHQYLSRPARVGDKLTVRNFNSGTHGFVADGDTNTAVCLLPGTEIAFAAPIRTAGIFGLRNRRKHRTPSSAKWTRSGSTPITTRWNCPMAR